ncbi:MAG: hypothetical protein AB8B85_00845 [Paracoccaceae bacterium]
MQIDQKTAKKNAIIVMALQACVGAISKNVRAVIIDISADDIELYFLVRVDDEDDREEANDIADELSILSETYRVRPFYKAIGETPLPPIPPGQITIYREKS